MSPASMPPPEVRSQRLKALAITRPLHDMEARKTQVQSVDLSNYQIPELALDALEMVAVAMDFTQGASPEQVTADLAERARQQAPNRPADEHQKVAAWILENLLNVGSTDRGFEVVYGVATSAGYGLRSYHFKLLEEYRGDGRVYVRASNEAVSVLIGALEVDLEAEHVAADARLRLLIDRGSMREAQHAAANSRLRTIQYAENLRQRIESARRDVRNVDWLHEMPAFLDNALRHIEARTRQESEILNFLTTIIDESQDPTRTAEAAAVIDLVKDCLRRHAQLHTELQLAGPKFRAEQDRQAYSTTPAPAALDLHAQLLVPALRQPLRDIKEPLAAFFTASNQPRPPRALRLADLFDELITPALTREHLGDAVDDLDLVEIEEPSRFPDASYRAVNRLLDLPVEEPVRLSELLHRARTTACTEPDATDLDLLLVIRVLAGAAPDLTEALANKDPRILLALDDGTPLDDPEYGGSDLLIAAAAIDAAVPGLHADDLTTDDSTTDDSTNADSTNADSEAPR